VYQRCWQRGVREAQNAERHPEQARVLDEFIGDPEATDFAALLRRHRFNAVTMMRRFPLRQARAQELRATRLHDARVRQTERYRSMLQDEIRRDRPRSAAAVARSNGVPVSALRRYASEFYSKLIETRASRASTASTSRSRAALLWREALQELPVPTFAEVSRRLGIPASVLDRKFPAECRELRARRASDRASRNAKIREAMLSELNGRSPRGPWAVSQRLGTSNSVLLRAAPDLYRRLGGRVPSPGVSPSSRQGRGRLDGDCLRRLNEALRQELLCADPRPPSVVAAELGFPRSCVDSYVETSGLSAELRARRRELRESLFERAHAMLKKEIQKPQPRSIAALSRDCGLSKVLLKKRFPELIRDLMEARRASSVCVTAPGSLPGTPEDRFPTALQAELDSDNPRPLSEVARSLGVTVRRLARAEPDLARRLRDRLAERVQYDRDRVRRCVVNALEQELHGETPRPVAVVARELGLPRQQLARLAPDLVRQVVSRRLGSDSSALFAGRVTGLNR